MNNNRRKFRLKKLEYLFKRPADAIGIYTFAYITMQYLTFIELRPTTLTWLFFCKLLATLTIKQSASVLIK